MNQTWLYAMYEICMKDPFRRKIILADRLQQAEQWLDRVATEHGPLLGVEMATIRLLVTSRTRLALSNAGIRLLDNTQSFWIIHNLMTGLAEKFFDYLPKEMLRPGIVRSFYRTVEELRLAGVTSADSGLISMGGHKGKYLGELLRLYENYMEQYGYTDFAGLLRWLPDRNVQVRQEDEELLIIRDRGRFSSVEQAMLDKIAGDRLVELPQGAHFPASLTQTDGRHIHFYHATGMLAEIREAWRRICRQHQFFDQTEIIVSSYEEYSIAIYAISQTLEMPCTFSQGLPVSCTKIGKAALAYLDWLENNYDVDCLLRALRHDYITFRQFGDQVSTAEMIRTLEQSGIGWGRQRFSLLESAATTEESSDRHEALRLLGRVMNALFRKLPDESEEAWTPLVILRALVDYLEKCTIPSGEADMMVVTELSELVSQLEMVNPQALSSEYAIRYVRELIGEIRVYRSGPQPGKVHISSMHDGGETGRRCTFILGMSNEAWTVEIRQDPVLLDEERLHLGQLPTATKLSEQNVQERAIRLGTLGGTLTLSYSCYDPADQKEITPAFEYLQSVRMITNDQEMDLSGLEHFLGKPLGYMSSGLQDDYLLDGTDRWLERFVEQGKMRDGSLSLNHSFPRRSALERAEMRRRATVLSEYEGIVGTDIFALQYIDHPQNYLSVTQLERYAGCPKKFFFSSILKVGPKEAAVFDRNRWLDPPNRGNLLHRIYHLYLDEMIRDSLSGSRLVHKKDRLQEWTERVIDEYVALVPPPSRHIFSKECESIRRDVAMFYQVEQQRTGKPRFLELELAIDDQPMEVVFDNDLVIRLKGYVDRVDEVGPHMYKIYDYKTGSPTKFEADEYFVQGTQLQHALYAVAVEQWLQRTGVDPQARVVESVYYFPTERGKGEEVSRAQERRTELATLLRNLYTSIESGIFPVTKDGTRCTYCDYRSVCRDESERTGPKWVLDVNQGLLQYLKEVEEYV